MAESFFATLECELLDRTRLETLAQAHMAVFEWIEGWYNSHRRHSSIGYLSPIEFERRHAVAVDLRGGAPEPLTRSRRRGRVGTAQSLRQTRGGSVKRGAWHAGSHTTRTREGATMNDCYSNRPHLP